MTSFQDVFTVSIQIIGMYILLRVFLHLPCTFKCFAYMTCNKVLIFLLQNTGPIKERDGRVRHFKGLGEEVQQETALGKTK